MSTLLDVHHRSLYPLSRTGMTTNEAHDDGVMIVTPPDPELNPTGLMKRNDQDKRAITPPRSRERRGDHSSSHRRDDDRHRHHHQGASSSSRERTSQDRPRSTVTSHHHRGSPSSSRSTADPPRRDSFEQRSTSRPTAPIPPLLEVPVRPPLVPKIVVTKKPPAVRTSIEIPSASSTDGEISPPPPPKKDKKKKHQKRHRPHISSASEEETPRNVEPLETPVKRPKSTSSTPPAPKDKQSEQKVPSITPPKKVSAKSATDSARARAAGCTRSPVVALVPLPNEQASTSASSAPAATARHPQDTAQDQGTILRQLAGALLNAAGRLDSGDVPQAGASGILPGWNFLPMGRPRVTRTVGVQTSPIATLNSALTSMQEALGQLQQELRSGNATQPPPARADER